MIYLELFIGFLKVGLLSFGGAYGSIPLIKDIVLDYGWISEEMLTYMIGVSESTPGPIMVNLATYIGSYQSGLLGAIIASIAVVLPSFIIILIIGFKLKNLLKNYYIRSAIQGLKPCIIGIICATGLYMIIKNCMINQADYYSMLILGILILFKVIYKYIRKADVSPFTLIILSMVIGIMIYGV